MGKLHPADAYRKEQKKKEIKKSKKEREKVREVTNMLNNPDQIEQEIQRVQKESDTNKLDKRLKDRIKELKAMKVVADKKQRARELMTKGKSTEDESLGSTNAPTNMSVPPPPPPMTRRPEESAYFHPVFNPTGAPPPGQPALYRPLPPSSATPTPLTGASAPPQYSPYGPAPGYGPPPPPRAAPAPPGMSGMAVGGRNGVPLPPRAPPPPQAAPHIMMAMQGMTPRQMTPQAMAMGYIPAAPGGHPSHQGYYGPGTSEHGAPSDRQQQGWKPKERPRIGSAGGGVDPLDPAADGYTMRFGSQKRKMPNPASCSADVPGEQETLVTAEEEHQEEVQVQVDATVMPVSAASQAAPLQVAPSPPAQIVEIRAAPPREEAEGQIRPEKRSVAVAGLVDYGDDSDDDNEAPASPLGPSLAPSVSAVKIDVEALMKRRRMLPPDASGVGQDVVMRTSVGPDMGPGYGPSVGPDMGPSHGPSAGPDMGPSYGPSVGPDMGPGYGPSAGPDMGPSYGPSAGPDMGPSYGPSVGPDMGPSYGPSAPPVHPSSGATDCGGSSIMPVTEQRDPVPNSDSYDPTCVPMPATAVKVQVPKLVKVDSGLVSFVPAALRVKRQHQSKTDDTAVILDKFRRAGGSHSGQPRATAVAGNQKGADKKEKQASSSTVDATPAQASVDDVYANFMSEINELGGF